MAKKRPDGAYLLDMKNAVKMALEFTSGFKSASFQNDAKCQSAVLYQLAVLGEPAKHVSKVFREVHSDVPWRKITGLRDILIHAYHDLESDLPPLLAQLDKMELPRPRMRKKVKLLPSFVRSV